MGKTDNSALDLKVQVRLDCIKDGMKILEVFAGQGLIYSRVKQQRSIEVHQIELERGKNSLAVQGDSYRLIKQIDLSIYDVIDLDCWGNPAKIMDLVFKNKTLKPGTIIIYTQIESMFGRQPYNIIQLAGISIKMYKTFNRAINLMNDLLFDNFLWHNNIRTKTEYVLTKHKRYGIIKYIGGQV